MRRNARIALRANVHPSLSFIKTMFYSWIKEKIGKETRNYLAEGTYNVNATIYSYSVELKMSIYSEIDGK